MAPAAASRPAAAVAAVGDSVEPEVQYTVLQRTIATIFSQCQRTTAGHRKLVINLRSVLDQCVAGTGAVGSTIGCDGRDGEKAFTRDFCRFVNRVLVVKKSEVVGDRCLRLVDLLMMNLLESGSEWPLLPPYPRLS